MKNIKVAALAALAVMGSLQAQPVEIAKQTKWQQKLAAVKKSLCNKRTLAKVVATGVAWAVCCTVFYMSNNGVDLRAEALHACEQSLRKNQEHAFCNYKICIEPFVNKIMPFLGACYCIDYEFLQSGDALNLLNVVTSAGCSLV